MNITAVGEILFDIYPGRKNLGGAPFNFLYHITKLKGSGNFVSSVGDDEFGNEILNFMEKNNINKKYVQLNNEHPTGKAVANLDAKKVPHWEIKTETAYDFISTSPELNNLIENETDCLYFGTLARRSSVSRETIESLFNRKSIKYFCDLNIRQDFYDKEIIEKSLQTANVLKLNIDELKLVNDILINRPFEIVPLAEYILQIYKIDLLCITSGEEGAYLVSLKELNHYKKNIEKVIDTVGAGDAFAAILCVGYLSGWNIEKINRFASEFASEIVMIEGALPKDESIYQKFKEKFKDGNEKNTK